MKTTLFSLAGLLLMPAVANAAHLAGPIIGFEVKSGDNKCYLAIEDPTDRYYSGGYHHVEDKGICSIAKTAFMTGTKVVVETEILKMGETNKIKSIEMIRTGSVPYWPEGGKYDRLKGGSNS